MVRLYKRKIETRSAYDDEALREALTRVSQGNRLSVSGNSSAHVTTFFAIYKEFLQRNEYKPSKIWNIYDTCFTCVHRPGKIVASKGVRQVVIYPVCKPWKALTDKIG